jgi:hypothetical protein
MTARDRASLGTRRLAEYHANGKLPRRRLTVGGASRKEASMTQRSARVSFVLTAAVILSTCLAYGADKPKVVILGFDGADERLVTQWMDEGKLPNLAQLRSDGSYTSLQPTNPPQTPVSWSSFATGTNPGKTRIFDFLMRNPADYLPDFAMNSETRRPFLFGPRNGLVVGFIAGAAVFLIAFLIMLLFRIGWVTRLAIATLCGVAAGLPSGFVTTQFLPVEVPDVINHRQGSTMWELASKAGLKVQVIHVPATFPAEDVGRDTCCPAWAFRTCAAAWERPRSTPPIPPSSPAGGRTSSVSSSCGWPIDAARSRPA